MIDYLTQSTSRASSSVPRLISMAIIKRSTRSQKFRNITREILPSGASTRLSQSLSATAIARRKKDEAIANRMRHQSESHDTSQYDTYLQLCHLNRHDHS